MLDLKIEYKDFSGEISERHISDIQPETEFSINAYCHLRNERRTFKVANIDKAVDVNSGEVINNLWKAFGLELESDGREKLISITSEILPAIKALKSFSLQIRGFSSRERLHLIIFIQQLTKTEKYTSEEIDQWLQNLWCGNQMGEYLKSLSFISADIKPDCKIVALNIAKGSGRKPIEPKILERINTEFGLN